MKRPWAKVSQTPVSTADGGHRGKVSAIGALTVSPTRRRLGFYFATEPGGFFTADKVVGFLRDVLRHLRGNVVVVSDRGSNHRGLVYGTSRPGTNGCGSRCYLCEPRS